MTKAVSLQDVARAAGVSPSTASRVLNGTGRASEQTRQRIRETAERLDFRPDALAKFFSTGKSSTVGLLSRTEPSAFAMQVLIGAQMALGEHDLAALMYYARGEANTFREHVRSLKARRVDGVIFLGYSPDDTYPSLGLAANAPVVYAYASTDDPRDVAVIPDGVMAGRMAGEHFIDIGRRNIAHITGPQHLRAVIDRAAGLDECLAEAGLRIVMGGPLYGDWRLPWGVEATRRILAKRRRVDAIFCGNDQIALGTLYVLHEAGVRVPDDIAVIGYDHWSRLHGVPDSYLTTIDPRLSDLGGAAVSYLLRVLDGDDITGVQPRPCVLSAGQSTLGRGADAEAVPPWPLTGPLATPER